MAHHDALAVGAEHQQVTRLRRYVPLHLVEGVEVTSGAHDQLFDLPLGDLRPAAVANQLDDFVERAACALLRRHSPNTMREQLDG